MAVVLGENEAEQVSNLAQQKDAEANAVACEVDTNDARNDHAAASDNKAVDHDYSVEKSPQLTAEPAAEQPDHSNVVAAEDYSIFTVPQKRAIIVTGSFAALFSPM
jgi:hypothetical protein